MKSILRYCLLLLHLPTQSTIVRAQVTSTHRIGATIDASNICRPKNIAQILQSPEFQKTELIIGHVGLTNKPVVLFRKKGTQEDRPRPCLDSIIRTICIAGRFPRII